MEKQPDGPQIIALARARQRISAVGKPRESSDLRCEIQNRNAERDVRRSRSGLSGGPRENVSFDQSKARRHSRRFVGNKSIHGPRCARVIGARLFALDSLGTKINASHDPVTLSLSRAKRTNAAADTDFRLLGADSNLPNRPRGLTGGCHCHPRMSPSNGERIRARSMFFVSFFCFNFDAVRSAVCRSPVLLISLRSSSSRAARERET